MHFNAYKSKGMINFMLQIFFFANLKCIKQEIFLAK